MAAFYRGKRLARLMDAKDKARRAQKDRRDKRKEMIAEYTGEHYLGKSHPNRRVPVGALEMLVQVFTRTVASKPPRAMVTVRHRAGYTDAGRADALDLEADLNGALEESRFGDVLRGCFLDAMFQMGIAKVANNGLAGVWSGGGDDIPVFRPTCEQVSPNDWFHDPTATRWSQITFCGDRYRVPLSFVEESGLFSADVARRLSPTDRFGGDGNGDYDDDGESSREPFVDQVELWDCWDPIHKLVVTVCDQCRDTAIREVEWQGPDTGPYHLLLLGDVPDELYPLAPVLTLYDLHDLINKLFVKMARSALRKKDVLGYRGEDVEDARRIISADDGEAIRMDNAERAKEFRFGGVDNVGFALTIQVLSMFKEFGGNLNLMGGLGPQSETATQDQLLAMAANKKLSDMQDRAILFSESCMRAFADFLYSDPLLDRFGRRTVPGTSSSVPYRVGGPYFDRGAYAFKVNPYSMQHETPAGKLRDLQEIIANVLGPLAPFMQAQGGIPNVEEILRLVARYKHFEDLDNIITWSGSPLAGTSPGGAETPTPPVTRRIYERINRPGATPAGRDQILMQHLLGGHLQDAERESLTRAGT